MEKDPIKRLEAYDRAAKRTETIQGFLATTFVPGILVGWIFSTPENKIWLGFDPGFIGLGIGFCIAVYVYFIKPRMKND